MKEETSRNLQNLTGLVEATIEEKLANVEVPEKPLDGNATSASSADLDKRFKKLKKKLGKQLENQLNTKFNEKMTTDALLAKMKDE